MGEVSTIGLDLAKTVFQAHGADASGGVIFRKKLRAGTGAGVLAAAAGCAWWRWRPAAGAIIGRREIA